MIADDLMIPVNARNRTPVLLRKGRPSSDVIFEKNQ